MFISIKLCTGAPIGRIDEVTEIPRMLQLSQFILGNSHYIIALTVDRYHEVSASIARKW
jgi:hypothetical protein